MTGLEALTKLSNRVVELQDGETANIEDLYFAIEKELKENERLKTSYLENLLNEESKEYIYKKLKALEIIVKKDVNTYWIRQATNLSEYNYFVANLYYNDVFEDLTEDEFNLIKGVLKNDTKNN